MNDNFLALPFILCLAAIFIVPFLIYNIVFVSLSMFKQSGIKTFTLYNAATTTFTQVSATSITNIVGDSILIDNSNKPNLEQTVKKINRRNYIDYLFSFVVFDLDSSMNQYRNKFGWFILIEFLDGEQRFLNTPSFFNETDFDTSKTHVYPVELKPDRPTGKTLEVV